MYERLTVFTRRPKGMMSSTLVTWLIWSLAVLYVENARSRHSTSLPKCLNTFVARAFSLDLTDCPWVSEDDHIVMPDENLRQYEIHSPTASLSSDVLGDVHQPEVYFCTFQPWFLINVWSNRLYKRNKIFRALKVGRVKASWREKGSLPVDKRRSKTSFLKFSNKC